MSTVSNPRMIVSLLLFFCAVTAAQNPLSVQVTEVASRQVDERITLSGEVNSLKTSRLSLETQGMVAALYVDVGSRVEQGEALLKLDEALARQSLKEAEAGVIAAQAAFNDAQRLFEEADKLRDKKSIAESELRSRKSRRDEAQSMLQQAIARRDYQQTVLAKHTLNAPFSGVIAQKSVEVGEWHQTGSPVLQLVSTEQIRVDVRLPQEVFPRLRDIKQVTLMPDTAPEQNIEGKIATVVPVGTSAGRSFLVRLAPVSPDERLIPGTSARASIAFKVKAQAIVVPRDALLRQPDGNVSAYIVEDGIARRRLLTLGGNGDYGFEVLKGLQAGDRVVIRGNEVLSDGQSVTVREDNLGGSSP